MTGSVTVPALLSWRPEDVGDRAAELGRTAESWRTAMAEARSLVADLHQQVWSGEAADRARADGDEMVVALGEAAEAVEFASKALRHAADAMGAARELLLSGQALADTNSLPMFDDGRVPEPPPVMYSADLDAARQAEIVSGWRDVRDAAVAASAMATEALAAADEADREAAAAMELATFAPRTADRFGHGLLGLLATMLPGDIVTAMRSALLRVLAGREVPPAGTDPHQVAAWWASLSPQARALALRHYPERIGNLDGVPYAVRDRANRTVLTSEIAAIRAEMTALQEHPERFEWPHPDGANHAVGRYLQLEEQLEMLRSVETSLGPPDARPPRSLVLLDTGMPGRAAVGIGDLDAATHVSVMVPGMGTTVTGSLGRYVDAAARLNATQDRWGEVLGVEEAPATVAWLGYEAPGLGSVAFDGRAETGADDLQNTLTGLHAQSASTGTERELTLIGHSYGSLVSGLAVTEYTGTDSVVFVGSPGVGAGEVADLAVPEVYVGEAGGDHVADFGRFGGDPGTPEFGARIMSVDGGTDPLTGSEMAPSSGHSEYYDQDTESLRNLALIGLGRGELITEGEPGGSLTGTAKETISWLIPGI